MRHTISSIIASAIVAVQATTAAAQGAQPAARPAPAKTDQRVSTLTGFTIDYPKKDWLRFGGVGSSLAVLAQKNGEMTVAIERTRLRVAQAPSDLIDETGRLEMEDWQRRRPASSGYSFQIGDHVGGARTIVIDFTQPGPQNAEHVRIYAFPRGTDWYRIICTTPQATFQKQQDTCHRIALSFTPSASQ